jgi:hypothetical protein
MTKPKTKMVRIPAQELRIHPVAQRDPLPSKEKRLSANFDLDAIGCLHAVQYTINGELATWLIDGQHRHRILMAHGFGEGVVDVKIHLDVTDDARASALFLKLNDRSIVSPFDKFKNEVTSGVASACGVRDLARARGLVPTTGAGDGNIRCVTALKRVFEFDNGRSLGRTLDTVITAWGRIDAALDGKIIEGVGTIYKTFGGEVDQDALAKKLAKFPGGASGILGHARGLRDLHKATMPQCVMEAILDLYNSGRRARKLAVNGFARD